MDISVEVDTTWPTEWDEDNYTTPSITRRSKPRIWHLLRELGYKSTNYKYYVYQDSKPLTSILFTPTKTVCTYSMRGIPDSTSREYLRLEAIELANKHWIQYLQDIA
jgi:hypothetical protein